MTKAVFRKHGMTLLPVDDESRELIAKIKDNRDVIVDIKQARSPRHHRLFYGICKFVKMHSETMADASIDQIKNALKLATGFVETYVDCQTGKSMYVAKSIAWESMDQTEFYVFFDAACAVVANRWLPDGTTPEDVRRELLSIIDGPHVVGRMA